MSITREEFDSHLVKALAIFGHRKQMNQALEELNELMQAILKYNRAKENSDLEKTEEIKLISNILEERIDVYIMLQQLDLMFGFTNEEFTRMLKLKVDKLSGHIEKKTETKEP